MASRIVCFTALPHDAGFDRVELVVTPRLKESELSGDEWRTGVQVVFSRKGVEVRRAFVTSMDAALRLLGYESVMAVEQSPFPLWSFDDGKCMQPGCSEEATVEYRLRERYSAQGEGPLPPIHGIEYRRRFCERHRCRGDCSLDDCDRNYEEVPRG